MQEDLLRFNSTAKLLLLDCETESTCLLIPTCNVAWQVGMIKAQGNNVLESYSSFLKWDRPLNVSEGAAKKTHFDKEKVEAGGIYYKDVAAKVIEWMDWADWIVGQNILAFDLFFLKHFYRLFGRSTVHLAEKILDTHALLKGIKMKIPFDKKKQSLLEYQYQMINIKAKGIKTNLTTVGQEMGIPFNYETLHEAANDVALTFEVFKKIKFMAEI